MKKSLVALSLALIFSLPLCLNFTVFTAEAQAGERLEEKVVWYRIHLGSGTGKQALTAKQVQKFIDEVISPRFPSGLTIYEARGQWSSAEHGIIKEKTFVVDVQSANIEEAAKSIREIGRLYVDRFKAAKASIYFLRLYNTATMLQY